jgi:hypothetical protein
MSKFQKGTVEVNSLTIRFFRRKLRLWDVVELLWSLKYGGS